MTSPPSVTEAPLVLADGTVFEGEADRGRPAGRRRDRRGRVQHRAMSGYQEVITDPSYAGQIITFTYPHIGNYGVNAADDESRRPFCRGVVVRDLARRRSQLAGERRPRRLPAPPTACPASPASTPAASPATSATRAPCPARSARADGGHAEAAPTAEPGTDGVDLVAEVTTAAPYTVGDRAPAGSWPTTSASSTAILRQPRRDRHRRGGARVDARPTTSWPVEPDGVFLSNGPGDPAAVDGAVDATRRAARQVPVFGICLGHQLLGLALGGRTYKLPFGHHGGNHPVRDWPPAAVEITSQNHNFAVDGGLGRPAREVTHVNLNDGAVEGFALHRRPGLRRAVPPRGRPRPARRRATCSTGSPSSWTAPPANGAA